MPLIILMELMVSLSFTSLSTLMILYFLIVKQNHYLIYEQNTEFFLMTISISIIVFFYFLISHFLNFQNFFRR